MSAVICIAAVLMVFRLSDASAEPVGQSLSPEESLGQRMYRDGVLPSGEPMQALVKGDIPVAGTSFTCVSCHMRAGLGSFEGGVYTPPTNGSYLFQPLKMIYKGNVQDQVTPRRPAYTDASLAELLRHGIDPAGNIMNDVMPRYLLEDKEMALLISYLKTLSAKLPPGVTDTTLSLATVVADDVNPDERDAMLAPLERYVANKNNLASYFRTQAGGRSLKMAVSMSNSPELALRKLSLTRWTLKGSPATWRSQLEEYYRREPVFALIGGIAAGDWMPVHRFCEENQIPCIFPNTDFPVISGADWYTLYLSKGYYQEGEGAARYLNRTAQAGKGRPIVQIVRDSREGKALSAGFDKTWRELGHEPPETVTLKAGENFTENAWQRLAEKDEPAAVLFWDGAGALPSLEALNTAKKRPKMVLISFGYVGKDIRSVKEEVRDFIYVTYPYRLPRSPKENRQSPMGKAFPADTSKTANQTYAIIEVLNMALMGMRGNYYRDNLLDVVDCLMDQEVPLFERLSFGPGQRYASKGCYIVQLSKGEKPELIMKSDWVIH